ncbi:hypothetical protein [Mycolicibacterium phocaicum]|uniref:Uncharacterized protein n=1 Tax=Mycolicibacterium phocaicum TaxID=319706 RepID=A0A7I7ZZ91_9MYCO|nr:hypothetical protein [Mycolicibacterium phocaicum]TLH58322.1 hypothetical protein C1S79_27820 [Mycolicibacterium phocaicum]BBZ58151.1 hypothetical protein MPHO_51430 [Mycolicibacterium phocaicum]
MSTTSIDTETSTAETDSIHADPADTIPTTDTATGENDEGDADNGDGDAVADSAKEPRSRRLSWSGLVVFGVLPLIVVTLAAGAGYLKFRDGAIRGSDLARTGSVQAATEATVAMLSYNPNNVDAALHSAQDRLTGSFRESYRALVDDVVIPGAKQKKIAAAATVPAAASITATDTHATVMVFVNQSTIVGNDAPTASASAVEVTLDKVNQRWLVSGFEPK